LIRDYIAEHERITTLGYRALKAMGHGRLDDAREMIATMRELLVAHWKGEENGVFVPMAAADEATAEYIATLMSEHRDLDTFLADIDLGDEDHVRRFAQEMADLDDHIVREEDGVFPATLVTLSGPEWTAAIDAWHEAHPGEELIAD
jgi:iron-sulfur cluster repair protein YtfE (RIC family)